MNDSDDRIFQSIVNELDLTEEGTCARQLLKVIDYLASLAGNHWLRRGKEDLWHAAKPIWLELREQAEIHARQEGSELGASQFLEEKQNLDARDLVFLADTSIYGDTPRRRSVAIEALNRILKFPTSGLTRSCKAIDLLSRLLDRAQMVVEVRVNDWGMIETGERLVGLRPASVAPDLPTVTSRRSRFRKDNRSATSVHIGFPEHPDLHQNLVDAYEGNEGAIIRILEMFDDANSPRLRNACVEALRSIGGCLVSQKLSERVDPGWRNPLYVQWLVLCALDGLASQPYRPADERIETLVLQRETTRLVLGRLLEYESQSADLKALRDCAVEGVKKHAAACDGY